MLHAHHVIPLAFGGDDAEANLVLLCPNHHAIAHALGDYKPSGMPSRSGWYGPTHPRGHDPRNPPLAARLRGGMGALGGWGP
jgi:5-methylcytosine-specific restriction endonuclease McrA